MPVTGAQARRAFVLVVPVALGWSALAPASALAAGPTKQACVAASENGQQLRAATKLSAARDELIKCAADACPKLVRADCAEQLAEVTRALPSIVFDFMTPDGMDLANVAIVVDGAPVTVAAGAPLSVDPGKHTFVFSGAGLRPVSREIVIAQGAKDRHERVVLGEPRVAAPVPHAPATATAPSAAPSRVGPWLTLGAAVVQLGVGGAFVGLAASKYSSLHSSCSPLCDPASAQPGRTESKVADVLFVTGGLTLAGSVVWWLVSPRASKQETSARVGLSLAPGGLKLEGVF